MSQILLIWFCRTTLGLLVVAAVLPWLPTGAWMVRLFDFPRVQLLALLLLPLLALILHAVFSRGWQGEHWVLLAAIAFVGVCELSHIAPFTPLWSKELPDGQSADSVSLMVANVEFSNQQREEVRQVLQSHDPDLLLLVEIDEQWEAALQPLRKSYPHRTEEIRGEGLGLALWSKLPLEEAEVKYLVSERRPSIFATILLPDGNRARFVGLHPTPPGLNDGKGGRRDSRVRDAELVLVARQVENDTQTPWIVAGDLNDVAWSHTTRLFKRLSGLRDPRVGRRLLNTYHADHPLLRYPIDQVFLSAGSQVSSLERVRLPGSDHFGIVTEFQMAARGEDSPATPEDRSEAREIVEEGQADAES